MAWFLVVESAHPGSSPKLGVTFAWITPGFGAILSMVDDVSLDNEASTMISSISQDLSAQSVCSCIVFLKKN